MTHPIKEELQLVIAAVDTSIGQQADQVKGALCGCRRNVLPAFHTKELARFKSLVHQPSSLVHLHMTITTVSLLVSGILWEGQHSLRSLNLGTSR